MNRTIWIAMAALLAGCGTNLKHIEVSPAEYRAELAKQRQMAEQVRQEREARLQRVAGRIRTAAEQLCQPLGGTNCSYPASYVEDDIINAFADGKGINVTSGLIRFTENDDELAAVVGHEYAHNMLAHLDKKKGNLWIGAILGGMLDVAAAAGGVNTHGVFMRSGMNAGASAYSQAFEAEADYAGLYLAAQAGYDIHRASYFFRRMGMEHSGSREYGGSHPSTPERFIAMERTIQEIDSKRQAGLPLVPDKRDENPKTTSLPSKPSSQESAQPAPKQEVQEQPKGPVGEFEFAAEQAAMELGCFGEKGVRPKMQLFEKAPGHERYQTLCNGNSLLYVTCNYGCKADQ